MCLDSKIAGHKIYLKEGEMYLRPLSKLFQFQKKDPNIFVSTVEGAPEIDDIKAMLLEKKIKKASLILFISVAGNSARNDPNQQQYV